MTTTKETISFFNEAFIFAPPVLLVLLLSLILHNADTLQLFFQKLPDDYVS